MTLNIFKDCHLGYLNLDIARLHFVVAIYTQNNVPEGTVFCDINGFVQERRNSSALATELRLSCTNPSIFQCYPENREVSITMWATPF